jgi:hypothetical protein
MDRAVHTYDRHVLAGRVAALIPQWARESAKKAAALSAVVLVAALVGREIALNDQMAVLLIAAVLGALMITAPAGLWIVGALIAAIALRGLVTLGLPSVITFLDIPLAWGALISAVLRRRGWSPFARRYLRFLIALCLAVLASWAFHPTEAVRPLLYLALIGEPFALLGALLIDPPSRRLRKALVFTAGALVAIQVPIAIGQAKVVGLGDPVKGTLHGAGAGAHVMAAIVVLGALWLLASRRGSAIWRVPVIALLLMIPLLAEAKQVLFVLPLGILVMPWSLGGRRSWMLRGLVGVAGLLALFYLHPFANEAKSADSFIREAGSGRTGKFAVGRLIGHALTEDPSTFLFGKGPAQTVSRAAFMTTDLLLKEDSPLRMFHLKPAEIAVEAEAQANLLTLTDVPGHGTSFNSGQTSALGVLGDLGVVGALIYVSLVASIFFAVRRVRSPEAAAAVAGWAMFAVLGFIFDWWEQPPFTLFLVLVTGLALTRPSIERPDGGGTAAARAPTAELVPV